MLDVRPLHPHAVASPDGLFAKKQQREHAEEAPDDAHVHLRSRWVFSSLRHPLWKLVVCVVRLALCFLACVTSPLLTSRQAPAYYPVYSDLVGVLLACPTLAKGLLHGSLTLVLVVFLRLVVYRAWFEDQWNWRRQYALARQTFTRLSGLSTSATERSGDEATISLLVAKSRTREDAVTRVRVHTAPRAQGSWTLLALLFPVSWAASASVLRRLVAGTEFDDLFFEKAGFAASLPQWRLQFVVAITLMTLNMISLVFTMDEVLQDRRHCGLALGGLRRVYCYSTILRILWCWILLALIAVGGIYFGGFTAFWTWCLKNWSDHASASPRFVRTLLSESWRCVLSSLVVVLDLVWLVQDWHFPGFATAVGTKIFGFHRDFIEIPLARGKRLYLTSKWTNLFVALGIVLPLDMCNFYQELTYQPSKYGQVMTVSSGSRVFPLTNGTTSGEPNVIKQLLRDGSIGRFTLQSRLDRVPALVCILMMAALCYWLRNREQWRLCYAAFLGQPSPSARERAKMEINASVPKSTRVALKDQMRVYNLYRLRSQFDLLGSCLAVVSVGLVILQVRSIWRTSNGASPEVEATAGETYGVLLLAISILMVYQLYNRYAVKFEILVLRNQIPRGSLGQWWSGTPRTLLLYPFLMEVLLSALCLPPFLHGDIDFNEERYFVIPSKTSRLSCPVRMVPGDVDDEGYASCDLEYSYPIEVLNLFVLIRLYWFVRLLRNELFRRLFADHAALLVTAGIGGNVPSEISSLRWSFRMCLSLIPGRVIFGIFFMLWTGTAAAVSILERPFPSLLDHEEHSLWLTIVTISAVGYGDAYPLTAFGRLSIVLGAVIGGAVVVSLMTSIFLDMLKGSKDEQKFVQELERIMWEKKLQHLSATLIATAWRASKLRQTHNSRSVGESVFKLAHGFKASRKLYRPKETFENLEQLRIAAISKWRTAQMKQWTEESAQKRNQMVSMIEREVAALEAAIQPLLK